MATFFQWVNRTLNPQALALYYQLKIAGAPTHKENPFVYMIELQTSNDPNLMKQVDGKYETNVGRSPDDPGAILYGAKLAALEEKFLPPIAPTLLSRSLILVTYESLHEQSKNTGNLTTRQMISLRPPHFPRVPFDSLRPVRLSNMMLNKVHHGRYFICRAISQTVRLVAVQVAVEDIDGNVAELAFYNCFETSGLDHDDIFSLIPVNQIIIIKEPWFKLGTTGGRPTVRVDTPSDVMFLSPNDPLLQSCPDAWKGEGNMDVLAYKALGNEAVKKKQMQAAVQAYTAGLAIDPTASVLRLNRAFCHLQLGNLSLALDDARSASEDSALPDNARHKARFRMALAYYAMDRFSDALDILADEVAAKWSPTDFESLHKKARARLTEQTQGSYDWFALNKLANAYNGRQQISDVADYMGPVKVVRVNGKGGGRGLVTTRPVMAGELLIVTKPFALASPFEFSGRLRILDAESNTYSERTYYELIGRVARQLMGNHTAASSLLLDLYPGDNYQPQNLEESTSSGPTFLTHGGHPWAVPGEYAIGDIDMNKVAGIVKSNSFSMEYELEAGVLAKCDAIYLLPSLINHACYGTAIRNQVGSLVAMRASRDLREGEEITCSYIREVDCTTYLNREELLKLWVGSCNCDLCSADRRDGKDRCQRREQYMLELEQARMVEAMGHTELHSDRIYRELVTKIQSTYLDGRTAPMDSLAQAQSALAFANHIRNPEQAVRYYIDALQSNGVGVKRAPPKRVPANRSQLKRGALIIETNRFPSGIVGIINCIRIMLAICTIQYSIGNRALAGHWAVAALWTYEAFFGPGKKHFWEGLRLDERSTHLSALLEKFS